MSSLRNLCGKAMRVAKNEKGQGLVEYALILVLIAVVVLVMVQGIGGKANIAFSSINSAMTPSP